MKRFAELFFMLMILPITGMVISGCGNTDDNLPPLIKPAPKKAESMKHQAPEPSIDKEQHIKSLSAKMAPHFIENRGQVNNESVKYYLQVSGKTIYLTDTGMVMDIYRHKPREVDPEKAEKTRRG